MADDADKQIERTRLMEEYQASLEMTKAILLERGMGSPEFAAAEKATGDLWRRIREIDGDAGAD